MSTRSARFILAALLAWLCTLSAPAWAIRILACEPEWAALAREIGGDKADAFSATTAQQDPHHIEARPSLIARARNAELVVCTGVDLEAGWLPLLLRQSGNPAIQPGRPGYLEAATLVQRLEVPASVDRSLGDLHAGGNPHVHTDPRNIGRVAAVLAQRMAAIEPANAALFRSREQAFQQRWQAAVAGWEKQGAVLRGMPVVVHHREWVYLANWLGLREAGSLEPQPGVPPTPGHLAELLQKLKAEPARAVIHSPYNDARAAAFIAQRAGIPAVLLPYTVGGSERAKDLFGLYEDTLARLLAVPRS